MKFDFLKTENIYPEGWIYKQLKTQFDGLCGNLDKVWPDVKDSKWLGGDHEGWERLPYFLDGYIPMAYLLRDEDKMARSKKYISYILSHQADDGCFYPKGEEGKNGDIWSLFLINKVLTVYADCSGEDKAVEYAVYKCLKFLDEYIDRKTPYDWAQSRWYECIIPIIWMYKRRKEEWLIYLARRLKALGVNFDASISLWDRVKKEWAFDTHVVNIAMALKSEAVYCEITGEKPIGLAEKMLETLFNITVRLTDIFRETSVCRATARQGAANCAAWLRRCTVTNGLRHARVKASGSICLKGWLLTAYPPQLRVTCGGINTTNK